ncbi:CPCC family cysteine-rich protein [Paenibacillus radicis (ex Gao et al. 2016)]|uniref:Cysteine-rich CPCC domain-containing protein n=1 Tax=Paenibacillus radicis (ex Gao et al. 2016) TaxID=1737354 RepID=A0A917HGU7_9BACL|nr:CPCC family cysteine-rich protein [Paenibacillus radicis (ex Gao et al. 2016)]GGG78643.1 hypothetical protein GCM10010918_39490 [Paenibacillus radicis (ex Gao et al. 2016)]
MNEIASSNRVSCPCCGYLTLVERGGFEICCLCKWEDDGQDDPDADEVRGGSLTEARNNFKVNYTMYSDERNILSQSETEISTKKALMTEFDKLKTADDNSAEPIWDKINSLEEALADIVYESAIQYSDNVEKNQ